LDQVVKKHRAPRSEVIRRALELYFYRLESERDARIYEERPLDASELALADDAKAWQRSPAW
jgi:hypothetical protein